MGKNEITFLKLGGSLITDKTGFEAVRENVLLRIAAEIREACEEDPNLNLVIGHGSGSFGHFYGAKYGTRQGVQTREQWRGFTEVGAAASRLNALVRQALLDAGLTCMTLQPSASAMCVDGQIEALDVKPIELALSAGLIPIVHGDIAFDRVRGGTIISTEEIMDFIAGILKPRWFLLAGETKGVLDIKGQVIPRITSANVQDFVANLAGSRGTDVTGGMFSKVKQMVSLAERQPQIEIRIFSGLNPGSIRGALVHETDVGGTIISL